MSEIEWNLPSEFPDELSEGNQNFSTDVFVYSERTGEHTVGWYDWKVMTWRFLCREPFPEFKWRYFIDEIDKYKK